MLVPLFPVVITAAIAYIEKLKIDKIPFITFVIMLILVQFYFAIQSWPLGSIIQNLDDIGIGGLFTMNEKIVACSGLMLLFIIQIVGYYKRLSKDIKGVLITICGYTIFGIICAVVLWTSPIHKQKSANDLIAEYREKVKEDPNSFNAVSSLGIIYIRTGNCDSGLVYIKKAASLSPSNWELRKFLISALSNCKKFDDLIPEIDKAIADFPSNPEVEGLKSYKNSLIQQAPK